MPSKSAFCKALAVSLGWHLSFGKALAFGKAFLAVAFGKALAFAFGKALAFAFGTTVFFGGFFKIPFPMAARGCCDVQICNAVYAMCLCHEALAKGHLMKP